MQVVQALSPLPEKTALALGSFDGLHRGHAALLAHAARLGERVGLLTFDPHPARVLAGDRAPRLLQTEAQRQRVARWLGVDVYVLLPFDRAVASLDAPTFIDRYLERGLRPHAVVVGDDFRYARDREGDTRLLQAVLGRAGRHVEVVSRVAWLGAPISSTAIRRALADGDVARVDSLLGRPWAAVGEVVVGAQRGRTLGFPTANVRVGSELLPPTGVYAAALSVLDGGGAGPWAAAASVGDNPSFADGPATTTGLEVHVIDRDLGTTLYGRQVEVSFIERIRPQRVFAEITALELAIADDVARCRQRLRPEVLARVCPPDPLPRTRAHAWAQGAEP